AGQLSDVDDALTDSSEGLMTRLNAGRNQLNADSSCLSRLARQASAFADDAQSMTCHQKTGGALAEFQRHTEKLLQLRRAIDGWAGSAIAAFQAGCPDPANPTAAQKPYCDGMARVRASQAAEDGQLDGAVAALRAAWSAAD